MAPGVGEKPTRANVLIVDDDPSMCEILGAELESRGIAVALETSPHRAVESLGSRPVDVLIADLHMPGMTGIELGERVQAARPGLPVVLLTAFGSMEAAVASMRVRAFDFLTKPPDIDTLVATIDRASRQARLAERVSSPDRQNEEIIPEPLEGIVGASPAMRELVHLVHQVAAVDAAVLIRGESGTGKELVARALHDRSSRRGGPFVALNCAAITGTLLEAELFGHVKGAFTDAHADRTGMFELARGGTLFLDEIADLHLALQPKLLRALQERRIRPVGSDREVEVDVRLITATNADLAAAVEEHRFRTDLYYRLNVIEIPVPPLRDRGDDVLLLAQQFVERSARAMRRNVAGLTPSCAAMLASYDWPGNVRELANVVERAVALARAPRLTVDDLPEQVRTARVARPDRVAGVAEQLIPLKDIELGYIRKVMEVTRGNKTLAAKILGVHRRTLYRKDLERKSG
jgi:DNA-binding NtrC family response regulator